MQTTILVVTLVLMAFIAIIFLRVVSSVGADTAAVDTDSRRTKFIWILLVAGVVITVLSLRPWPHAVAADGEIIQVNATGAQWSWEIDRRKIPLGKTVLFNLHTKDVNHGFGVFDAAGTLMFQMQAMPGYINQIKYVFDKPGTYRVLCLEYCGTAHHDMNDKFDVVAN